MAPSIMTASKAQGPNSKTPMTMSYASMAPPVRPARPRPLVSFGVRAFSEAARAGPHTLFDPDPWKTIRKASTRTGLAACRGASRS